MDIEKQKFIVLIHDKYGNTTALATILDNDEHWDLVDGQYINNINNNISLSIEKYDEDTACYNYSIYVNDDMLLEIIDTSSSTVITDRVNLYELMDILSKSSDCCIEHKSHSSCQAKISILGQDMTVSSTKLLSFGKKNKDIKINISIPVCI